MDNITANIIIEGYKEFDQTVSKCLNCEYSKKCINLKSDFKVATCTGYKEKGTKNIWSDFNDGSEIDIITFDLKIRKWSALVPNLWIVHIFDKKQFIKEMKINASSLDEAKTKAIENFNLMLKEIESNITAAFNELNKQVSKEGD